MPLFVTKTAIDKYLQSYSINGENVVKMNKTLMNLAASGIDSAHVKVD